MKKLKRNFIFEGFFDFVIDTYENAHGVEFDMCKVFTKAAGVAILPVTEDGKLLLLHEYRYAPEKEILTCPAGRISAGEPPEKAAERELLEETGYKPASLQSLGSIYQFPAISDQRAYLFLAKGCQKIQESCLEAPEIIRPELFDPKDIQKRALEETDIDQILLSLLLRASPHLKNVS